MTKGNASQNCLPPPASCRISCKMPATIPSDDGIDRVLAAILALSPKARPLLSSRHLDALFRSLAQPKPPRDPDLIEEMIFAHWISHIDRGAAETMAAGIEALASRQLPLARTLFDHLCARYPDWAEAFNKRATLFFIEGRDAESIADIEQVLRHEPRHFGAISGFGQICLRHGKSREAIAALGVALRLNPHLRGLRETIEVLSRTVSKPH